MIGRWLGSVICSIKSPGDLNDNALSLLSQGIARKPEPNISGAAQIE
jgi:hypothetical protein